MPETVKPRRYHSPLRAEQATRTRAAIVDAARHLLVTEGFTNTTVQRIAERAEVHVDTIYRSIGRKPEVLRAVFESAISGGPEAVPASLRDYVRQIKATSSAKEKIAIYAGAVTDIGQRLAPIYAALRDAARTDAESQALWQEISERRARNMRDFAADLRSAGGMREDLDDDAIADVVWSMNSPEYWLLLVDERGWSPERFRLWLIDTWCRLFLADAGLGPPSAAG